MAFTENLSPFFDTKGHAVAAVFTVNPSAVTPTTLQAKVIFEAPTEQVTVYDVDIEAAAPSLMVKTGDIPGVRRTSSVVVNGATYIVERVVPDGTGVSTVYLRTSS